MTVDARMVVSDCMTAPTSAVELNTREYRPEKARELWSQTLDSTYCEMDVVWPGSPVGAADFGAEIVARQAGELSLSVVRADPHTVVRTPAMIASDPGDDLLLCLITRGRASIVQQGHSGVLSDGSFGFVDASMPFTVAGETPFEQVVVRIPRATLSTRLPAAVVDDSLGRSISGTEGIGRVASRLLVDLAMHDDRLDEGSWAGVATAVLEVVSASVQQCSPHLSATQQSHTDDLSAIQRVLLRDIADPDRTLADVGAELGMSVRYIHKLFSASGTTPRAWLYARRLDRARTLLLQSEITCANLSEQLGFRDVSHFSRAFRKQFGISPGRYRRIPIGGVGVGV